MISRRHVVVIGAGLFVAAAAQAGSLDGTYTGTIHCGLLSNLSNPLKTAFSMTADGGSGHLRAADHSPDWPHRRLRARQRLGHARWGGRAPRGRGEGSYVFDAEYRGTLDGGPARLTGTQRSDNRGRPETRSCEIEVARAAPRS